MGTRPSKKTEARNNPLTHTSKGEAIIPGSHVKTLRDGNRPDGLMDAREALDAHTVLRTAIDAMSCDADALKQAVEQERQKTDSSTPRRLDMRLVIWVVGLLFIILGFDLLHQIL